MNSNRWNEESDKIRAVLTHEVFGQLWEAWYKVIRATPDASGVGDYVRAIAARENAELVGDGEINDPFGLAVRQSVTLIVYRAPRDRRDMLAQELLVAAKLMT